MSTVEKRAPETDVNNYYYGRKWFVLSKVLLYHKNYINF
ncbi:hypothetical protein SBF1_5330004 [Candidatus Desulfosporosinus infrequens]|uniref:Uncharacterized protein n=1 Tax=Candidatus Desulfosporosinus infrequens TaxID=2043169 RepID=A0A2U3LIP7_9FIRM|nr:hypothetical protein SBF1_5330004 [Candidatus Desulfosporosinus infrequens]